MCHRLLSSGIFGTDMSAESTPSYLLIHFSGPDRPGLTADLTHVLAAHDVNILDIGQAVVHETLALGILIEIPASKSVTSLKITLTEHARDLRLEPSFSAVSQESLERWLHDSYQPHFLITILGRTVTARHLARVSAILAAHAFNVYRIEPLTQHIASDIAANACIEISASGDLSREAAMRAEFTAAAEELSVDIAFQHESIFRRNRRLFAFDMDSTLIQGEVIDELARMAGVGDEVVKITEAAMRGELNFDESFTRRVSLLKGLPAERVYTLLDAIPLTEGAERLIRTLRRLGYKTAILSGGFKFFANHLQQKLGIDYVYANDLEIIDGTVTGRVIPPIVNGERKAALLKEIAGRESISLEQVVAVGDGANDIPMLSVAGMGIAYRAKPRVRQQASQSISWLGLDGLLYLIGVRDRDLRASEATESK
ncbi:ACT domain protein/phosphoserine phosphatase SerB [Acidobacterium capsulatum ATCC 51196]|uniref:Phosphoserine phosphatase n=2 Tax=Acidobacteriaceae TaxID=204434 RepID=C1F4Z9_ACIC5|nr:ACT domain protein/phosphoserine phosphatase SerB [Acidobacterium capsulatum ATCC 51196]